jgi:class 3 adenylate cyclase/pimeloyl-ACP methyl ester carboxylesterase/predicted Ser/Thr protein kinase
MNAPETRYARSGETTIAYQVVGEGPIDLVYVPGFLSHLDWNWEHPAYARFLRRLASFSRLILFDKRGTGMSDPVVGVPTLDERMDDLRAVMDAAGSEQAALLGVFEGGPIALAFAAAFPERVASLVLYASLSKFTQDAEYPWGWSPAAIRLYLSASEEGWGSGEGAEELAPSLADDQPYRAWFARLVRQSASPGMASALLKMNASIDVRPLLAGIQAPTLVLWRAGDRLVEAGHSRYLAEHLPGARSVELPGDDHWPWAGAADSVLSEIEELVTGTRGVPEPERVLTTVLFTDIVSSTEHARALGDRTWRELLEDHRTLVRKELGRFRGREIDTAGDGFFATFDSPTRAIRCAAAIVQAVRPLGIELRAGVHTGECQVSGNDLSGIHVHVGARVAGEAGPGEILVSRTVRDLVEGSDIRFEDRGSVVLKGIEGERQLFLAEVWAERGEDALEIRRRAGRASRLAELPPGSTLAGYEIEDVAGRGGMGIVYRARDQALERLVALKVIAPELAQDSRFRERFLREVRLAASLEHPHILPVYATGNEEGQLYLAMRYVEGDDLGQLVRQGWLDSDSALTILAQVASALDAAHARGLVHRDVKPGNILLDAARQAYLCDFGLARPTAGSALTRTGELLGTPDYLAPEQIRAELLDGRTDQYALACILYQCLAGETPFPHESDLQLMWAHMYEEPPSASERRPQLPARLDLVLARAMAKEPEERFGSCTELLAAARTAFDGDAVTPSVTFSGRPRGTREPT